MPEKQIDLSGYVVASEYRREIFVMLSIGPSTPDLLRLTLKMKRERVSLALRQLCDKDLVIRPPKDQFQGRVYRISPNGVKITNEVRGLAQQFKNVRARASG